MKYVWALIILLLIFACYSVGHQSLGKKLRLREPTVVFYHSGKPAYVTRTSIKDAMAILRSNPQYDCFEIDE